MDTTRDELRTDAHSLARAARGCAQTGNVELARSLATSAASRYTEYLYLLDCAICDRVGVSI